MQITILDMVNIRGICSVAVERCHGSMNIALKRMYQMRVFTPICREEITTILLAEEVKNVVVKLDR
jgi:hypothetical protein